MKSNRTALFLAFVPLALAACGSTTSTSGTAATTSPTPAASAAASPAGATTVVVKTGTATVSGASTTVLTDAQGATLYYRTGDGPTTVTCTGACAANWPPVLLPSGTPTGGTGVTGTLTVFAGPLGSQVLYNGHPLYLWVKDTSPGMATGQNIGGFKVVTPDVAAAG